VGTKIALVDQHGAFLGVRQGRFVLKVGKEIKWEFAPPELNSIVIATEGSSISAAAISLASAFGIDLVFMRGREAFS